MSNFMNRFLKDESGATAIEYGLIAALIAVVLVGSLGAVGTSLKGNFEKVALAVKV
ncbi:Flp family type IVb pilin [Phenylobacterium sp.]|jgi:pilus assembly protein Flp/PilA|uniref:Flp family type IVb pilin n=1 Tax=Phenylobacterium sp. TaxID=1871053 RepID=UPI0037C954EF